MQNIHPIQILMDEHQTILRVLDAFETRLQARGEEAFDGGFLSEALEFFRGFADACHHGKEEDQLFPVMEMRGVPRDGGPLGCMMKEHDFGRSCLAAVRSNLEAASAGSEDARRAVRDSGLAFVSMLRQHIDKEDNILFQMAMRALSSADFEKLSATFEDPANPKIAPETKAKYEALAGRLTAVAHA